VAKLLYKMRKSESFNRFASPILLLLCSLLRNYQNNVRFVDQAVIDQIIRKIVTPDKFINSKDALFESTDQVALDFTFNDKKVEMI